MNYDKLMNEGKGNSCIYCATGIIPIFAVRFPRRRRAYAGESNLHSDVRPYVIARYAVMKTACLYT